MPSRSDRSKHELVSTPAATRACFMSPMDTLSPLDARARSVAPRTRRDSIANAGADRRVATRDPENRVGAGSRLAPEGFARAAAARDRGRAVAGAAWHVAIVAEIIPSLRICACKDACARGKVPRKPLENYPTLPRHQILRIFSRWRWLGHHTRRRATTREGPHGL